MRDYDIGDGGSGAGADGVSRETWVGVVRMDGISGPAAIRPPVDAGLRWEPRSHQSDPEPATVLHAVDTGSVDPAAADQAAVDPAAGDVAAGGPAAGDQAAVGPAAEDSAAIDPGVLEPSPEGPVLEFSLEQELGAAWRSPVVAQSASGIDPPATPGVDPPTSPGIDPPISPAGPVAGGGVAPADVGEKLVTASLERDSGFAPAAPEPETVVSRSSTPADSHVEPAAPDAVPAPAASVPSAAESQPKATPVPSAAESLLSGSDPAPNAEPVADADPVWEAEPVPEAEPVADQETTTTPEVEPASPELEPAVGSSDDPPLAMEAKRAVQILNPSGGVTMPRPSHPRVMSVANQKGGVGKTTCTVNLAVALALHGNRVLVIDLDPQGNASTGLNVPHHAGVPDIYDCLVDTVALADVAQAVEGIPNLWCVPATIDLAGAEIELVSVVARESRLARAIAAYPEPFDYLLIDCPPSLGLLTVNALVAAREVLIPIQCEYYALEGLNQLLSNINMVQAHLNPDLDISTILLTMYDRRTRLADAVEQDVRSHFGEKVLTSVIPRNVRVSEAPSYGQSVMTYDPGSRGATSYFEAALEIAERGAKLGDAT